MQYLYRQTGQALQDMHPDSEETAELLEEHDVQDEEVDEGFSDLTEDPTVHHLGGQEAPAATSPGPATSDGAAVSPPVPTSKATVI